MLKIPSSSLFSLDENFDGLVKSPLLCVAGQWFAMVRCGGHVVVWFAPVVLLLQQVTCEKGECCDAGGVMLKVMMLIVMILVVITIMVVRVSGGMMTVYPLEWRCSVKKNGDE